MREGGPRGGRGERWALTLRGTATMRQRGRVRWIPLHVVGGQTRAQTETACGVVLFLFARLSKGRGRARLMRARVLTTLAPLNRHV